MPNWVYNEVKIIGELSDVADFIETASKPALFTSEGESISELSFANFIHPPQHALESGEYWATNGWENGQETGNTPNNWYNWNHDNWGTKWDACEVVMELGARATSYKFKTAWAPPTPVLEAMWKQFPQLRFEVWFEEEQGWGGQVHVEDGKIQWAKTWELTQYA
jgi:hypothetical protein